MAQLSVDTVNFHIKNAVRKLNATNKTGAVVRAAMLACHTNCTLPGGVLLASESAVSTRNMGWRYSWSGSRR